MKKLSAPVCRSDRVRGRLGVDIAHICIFAYHGLNPGCLFVIETSVLIELRTIHINRFISIVLDRCQG